MKAASVTIMASLVVYESTADLHPAADEATTHSDKATRMQCVGFIVEFGKTRENGVTDVGKQRRTDTVQKRFLNIFVRIFE